MFLYRYGIHHVAVVTSMQCRDTACARRGPRTSLKELGADFGFSSGRGRLAAQLSLMRPPRFIITYLCLDLVTPSLSPLPISKFFFNDDHHNRTSCRAHPPTLPNVEHRTIELYNGRRCSRSESSRGAYSRGSDGGRIDACNCPG
jgi:hypothetical protein